MSEFERRIKELWARLTAGLSSSAKTAGRKRDESAGNLRREASARAQQAAAKARDLRDSETAKKAASALHDLREGEAAKKAEAAINDLRSSETGKKAEAAIADLRQREPVKKAEESARKVLHDLFAGDGSSSGSGGSNSAS
jgi:membrane protein involved in colicin uptake